MAHTLTVTEDAAYAARIQAEGGDDAEVRDDAWTWDITCPHEPGDHSRPCHTYRECCSPPLMSDGEIDRLDHDGEGPCPVSPTGWHERVNCEEFSIGYRTGECYLRVGEGFDDQLREELLPKLSPGEHQLDITWDRNGDWRMVLAPGCGGEGGSDG